MAEMSFLLKNGIIHDASSIHHNKKFDILIEKGFIKEIGKNLTSKEVIDLKGSMITCGFTDLNARFMDPGFEHKENIASGVRVAMAGGFTSVALLPNSNPVVESKSDVEYILSKSGNPVRLHPIAALSEGCRGENMTEILDLNEAGAVGFSDGELPIWNTELLLKVLQYTQKFNGLVISRPMDVHLSKNAQMHEGRASTVLGLRGEPSLSEKIHIGAQLEILRYTGGRLHFTMISSKEGLSLIRNAKREGLNVTCDVGINHLCLTDESVAGFDTRFKIEPPFRTELDRKALIKGVNDGTIDAIVSGHCPQDRESKYLEFDLAEPGMISLQTVFSTLLSIQKEIDLDKALVALTNGPRKILGLEFSLIEAGCEANLAIFDANEDWVLNDQTNLSKSRNSPYWGKTLKGRCKGVVIGTNREIF